MRARILAAITLVPLMIGSGAVAFDAQTEGAKLLQRDAEWAGVASEGKDVEKTISYWSDDATIVPQGQQAIQGKAATREFVANSFHTPGFHIHWVSQNPVFSPDGKLAYLSGVAATTIPVNGKLITVPSRGITIWRLEVDGQWRCVVDIWNDPPAPSGPEPAPAPSSK